MWIVLGTTAICADVETIGRIAAMIPTHQQASFAVLDRLIVVTPPCRR